ncbi:hypothetical protein BC829DRAFT_383427 [Chytridium lagenaria]|nr:hypothetical protein BC829DRAFT_383427 [Chytridium lagenaria]
MNDLDSLLREMESPASQHRAPRGTPNARSAPNGMLRSNSGRTHPPTKPAGSGYASARGGSSSSLTPTSPLQNVTTAPPTTASTPVKKTNTEEEGLSSLPRKVATTATSRLDDLISSLDADIGAVSATSSIMSQPSPSQNKAPRKSHSSMADIDDEVEALEKELKAAEHSRARSNSKRVMDAARTDSIASIKSDLKAPARNASVSHRTEPVSPKNSSPPSPPMTPKSTASSVVDQQRSAPSKPMAPVTADSELPSYGNIFDNEPPKSEAPVNPRTICATCNTGILSGPVVSALGRSWHPHHFVCSGCEAALSPESFFEREDEPFCETCFKGVFAATCAYCNGIITEGCITALNTTWHPHHFFCTCCGKLFPPGAGFLEKDGKAYCEDDYFSLFATLCAGCSKPVVGEYVSAVDREWHPECFTCSDCDQPFPTGIFFEHQGQPYCELHYEQRLSATTPQQGYNNANPNTNTLGPLRHCPTCRYEVAPETPGTVVDPTTGARFHPTHYVCSVCKMATEGGILIRLGIDGREMEGGRTKGARVAARGPDGLICERCLTRA